MIVEDVVRYLSLNHTDYSVPFYNSDPVSVSSTAHIDSDDDDDDFDKYLSDNDSFDAEIDMLSQTITAASKIQKYIKYQLQ